MNETYMTLEETAKKVRTRPLTVRKWIVNGCYGYRLAATKVGKRWFVCPSTLDSFLNKLTQESKNNETQTIDS